MLSCNRCWPYSKPPRLPSISSPRLPSHLQQLSILQWKRLWLISPCSRLWYQRPSAPQGFASSLSNCAAMDSAFLASVCLHPLHLTIGCTRATYAKTCQDVQLICVSLALVLIMKSMAHLCMKRLLPTIPQSQSCLDIADRFPYPCVELLFIRRGLLLKLMAHLWWRRLLSTAPHLEVAIFSGYLTVCPSAA